MAWSERLPSGKYRGCYRDHTGKTRRVAGTFTQRAQALRKAAAAEDDARKAGWRDPDDARRTWGNWCEEWWPTRDVEPSTLKADTGRRDNYLMPRWRDVPLADIRRHDVKAWATTLRKHTKYRCPERTCDGTDPACEDVDTHEQRGLSANTVQRIVHLLSASLAAAVDAEIIPGNPAARLKLPPGAQAMDRYLERAEYVAIREELDQENALIADALAHLGLRWGEMAGLHRHRVDLRRGQVRVVEAWDTKGRQIKAYPKGRKIRTVPIPEWLVDDLRAWFQTHPDPGGCGLRHAEGVCRSGLVFTAPEGGVLSHSNWRNRVWTKVIELAQVDDDGAKRAVGHVRIHDLRHTYASWLIQDGASLEEVGQLLGHVSPLTTRRYAHLQENAGHARILTALPRPVVGRRGAERGANSHTIRLDETSPLPTGNPV